MRGLVLVLSLAWMINMSLGCSSATGILPTTKTDQSEPEPTVVPPTGLVGTPSTISPSISRRIFQFGQAVAVSGDTLVACNQYSVDVPNAVGMKRGRIFIYRKLGDGWTEEASIDEPKVGSDGSFGNNFAYYNVALDGNLLAVAARGDSNCTPGVNPTQSQDTCPGSGALYLYRRDGNAWHQEAYIKQSVVEPRGGFGGPVAVEGDLLAVHGQRMNNCPRDEIGNPLPGCQISGVVYVFEKLGGEWKETASLVSPSKGDSSGFGSGIAISKGRIAIGSLFDAGDGTGGGVLVGPKGPFKDSGAVYLFEKKGSSWENATYFRPSRPQENEQFGANLAFEDDVLVVSAANDSTSSKGVNGQEQGTGDAMTGAVYAFVKSGDTWSEEAYIKASSPQWHSNFGFSVAFHGGKLAVGAANELGDATDEYGFRDVSKSLSAGAVYYFVRDTSGWHQIAHIRAPDHIWMYDLFGQSVAVHDEGVVVGMGRFVSDPGAMPKTPAKPSDLKAFFYTHTFTQ